MSKKYTIKDFRADFPNDDACLHFIFSMKFSGVQTCPECGKPFKYHRVNNRRCYACQDCGNQIFPTAGTIFEKSRTSLTSWFHAIFMFHASRTGMSAKELQRHLGVTYKTAFKMGHAIRSLMDESGDIFFTGTVEIDETKIGGRKKGGKRGWGSDKPTVFGMLERGGKVLTQIVPDRTRETLLPIITNHTSEDVIAYTDEFGVYATLGREVSKHETVNHNQYEWRNGDCYTNSIEGAWSVRKRTIKGTYTSVKKLQPYLNEADFRHNHREECLFRVLIEKVGA